MRAPPFLLALAALAATSALAQAPTPRTLAPGVWLVPGGFPAGRQPDGNSVLFRGREGLLVLDTGRHAWHRDALLAFARERRLPVTAVLNSHWHLDHAGGNRALLAAFPRARLVTTGAVARMAREAFPEGVRRDLQALDAGQVPAALQEDVALDIEARRHPEALVPAAPVTASGPVTLDGLALELRVAPDAVTEADLWVLEPRSQVVAAGDLVTLPVPFLDTACTAGWRAALEAVAAVPFTTLVPGHGPPMDRATFLAYQRAFVRYLDCAHGTEPAAACADAWLEATAAMRAPEAPRDARALSMAGYYVELLRENGGDSPRCRRRPTPSP